jgi:membrane protein YqaA with SNARE-associated domain
VTYQALLLLATPWVREGLRFFRRMGALGLFLLGIGDSSFLFLPFSNDFLLVALVSRGRGSWMWIGYSLAAALGSVVGVALVDLVMRKAGEKGLEKFVSAKKLERLKGKMETRGVWTVFISTIMPPPFPFTAVIAAASALQVSRRGILLAVFAGRLVRFTIESLLALYFGRKLLRYLRSDYVEYFVLGLIAMAVVGTIISARKWLRARPRQAARVN